MEAPDLETRSSDTPTTPGFYQIEGDDAFLSVPMNDMFNEEFAENHDPALRWSVNSSKNNVNDLRETERRRSSGIAVQQLLSQLDGPQDAFDDNTSSPIMMDNSFESSPSWKVIVETAFAPKYFRNDRKNIQCFPVCTLGAPRNGSTESALGHGKSTTWCRGAVNARAFAIDPETSISDLSMFEAFGAFVMNGENPKTKILANTPSCIRGSIRKVDGRSMEIKIAPTVWKFEPALSKKKSEENRNQCFFVVFVTFFGREVGRCVSPPFDLGSQKAEIRKKRALANEEPAWGPKQLVLDTFAHAAKWAFSTSNPNFDHEQNVENDEAADVESGVQQANTLSKASQGNLSVSASSRSTEGSEVEPKQRNLMETALITASAAAPLKQINHKRVSVALLLWLPPFGLFGAHHFYLGRTAWALVNLFTFNLFFVGWLTDAVRLPLLVFAANFASPALDKSRKSPTFMEYFTLWLLFGLFGGHRYIIGDWRSGLLYTLTLGGLGMLWIWDGCHLQNLYKTTQS